MIQDDLIVRLGRSQQKVMSLSVEKRALAQRVEAAEARTEILDELIFDIVLDLDDGADFREILWRIRKVMLKIDEEDRENEEEDEEDEDEDEDEEDQ